MKTMWVHDADVRHDRPDEADRDEWREVVDKSESDANDIKWVDIVNVKIKGRDEAIAMLSNVQDALEYLISRLPEECTGGFITHARAIASGDQAEIERTK